jgi:drug/metabolite transporter (DMT)-like permease
MIGFSFLGVKTGVEIASALQTLTYRYNFAFLASLIPIILGIAKVELSGKLNIRYLLVTAGFYVGFMILQAIGLMFATSIESGIIFALIPILVKIIAWLVLGEKGDWKQNVFVAISVSAVVIMFVLGAQDISVSIVGLIILFLSSLSMALSNVFMRYVRNEFKPFTITFAICLGGFVLFNIATLVYGIYSGTLNQYFAPLVYPEFIFSTAFLGIPCTLLSSLLLTYMLAHLQAVKATVFGNLSTAISIVVGALILKEPLYIYLIVCTALILLGVIGTSISSSRVEEESVEAENG